MKPSLLMPSILLFVPLAATGSEANLTGPPKESVELSDMEVTSQKQELALRFIKAGLEADRSMRYEDRNKPYCWFDKTTGSHQVYLYCGLQRSLNASSRYWRAKFTPPFGVRAAGTLKDRRNVARSAFAVNRVAVERMIARLGPSELNDEIVSEALRGAPLPDDVPSETEVDRFVRALRAVRSLRGASVAQAEMTAAIRDAGLTVERYNQISDLVERYDSLREMVTERM